MEHTYKIGDWVITTNGNILQIIESLTDSTLKCKYVNNTIRNLHIGILQALPKLKIGDNWKFNNKNVIVEKYEEGIGCKNCIFYSICSINSTVNNAQINVDICRDITIGTIFKEITNNNITPSTPQLIDPPIGSIINIDGTTCEVINIIDSNGCVDCYYKGKPCKDKKYRCISKNRKDNTSVMFKPIDIIFNSSNSSGLLTGPGCKTSSEKLIIHTNGNIGITEDKLPTEKLEIYGQSNIIKVTTEIIIKPKPLKSTKL